MSEMLTTPSVERSNPFDSNHTNKEGHDEESDGICETYNASLRQSTVSGETEDFGQSIVDNYFDEPLIHINADSSMNELEQAIVRFKHMVLATPMTSVVQRKRLMDRLIELRRILHNAKELPEIDATLMDTPGENRSSFSYGTRTSRPIWHRSASQTSLSRTSSRKTSRYRSVSPGLVYPGGHDFHLVLALRHVGSICEQCCRPMRNPSRRILHCSTCQIVCHPQSCIRGLTRHCPGLVDNPTTTTHVQSIRSSLHQMREFEDATDPTAKSQMLSERSSSLIGPSQTCFRHLEVLRPGQIGANLSAQYWACFECRRPLKPAPHGTVMAEASMMSRLVQQTNALADSGISVLHHRATASELDYTTPSWMPQMYGKVPSLADRDQLQSPSQGTWIPFPDRSGSPNLHWIYCGNSHCSGPIQTWEDARVAEALNRLHRHATAKESVIASSGAPLETVSHSDRSGVGSLSQTSMESLSAESIKSDEARLCYYSGWFYCSRCHWADSHMVPACVFILGDNRPKPVSRAALLWLTYAWPRNPFRIPHPWYSHETSAQRVCALRLRLFRLKPYLESCERLLKIKSDSEPIQPAWLFDQPYTFLMSLVNAVLDGSLAIKLQTFLDTVAKHVRTCRTCTSRVPSICCVCHKDAVQAYEPLGALCHSCARICHRSCLSSPLPESMSTIHPPPADKRDDADRVEANYPAMHVFCSLCKQPAFK